jgi:hypothetical protein
MTTKKILVIFLTFLLISCSKKEESITPESPELTEMRKQKAIWDARKIKSYSIDHLKLCYCFDAGRYKLVIKNEVIESAFNIDSNTYEDSKVLKGLKTVDQLYVFIEATLKAKPFFTLIEYDKEGVPTRVSFDINELIHDEEIEYFNGGLTEIKQ